MGSMQFWYTGEQRTLLSEGPDGGGRIQLQLVRRACVPAEGTADTKSSQEKRAWCFKKQQGSRCGRGGRMGNEVRDSTDKT